MGVVHAGSSAADRSIGLDSSVRSTVRVRVEIDSIRKSPTCSCKTTHNILHYTSDESHLAVIPTCQWECARRLVCCVLCDHCLSESDMKWNNRTPPWRPVVSATVASKLFLFHMNESVTSNIQIEKCVDRTN